MLRAVVLLLALAALIGGIVALASGACPPALVFGLWGVLILVGTVFERVRYKALLQRAPGSGWKPTSERFVDPTSGDPVTVYVDPVSGERIYVKE